MTVRRQYLLPLLGVILLGFAIDWTHHESTGRPEPDSSVPPADPAVLAAGADNGWWQTVSTHIQSEEYHANLGATGLQAPNRAQNLRTHFRNDGIEVVPRQAASEDMVWRFQWSTTCWGREDHMRTVKPVAARSEGARVDYPRQNFDEWYENKPEGLEQGFTIHIRPEGSGWLRVLGRLEGGLHAQPGDDGAVDFLDAGGARVLSYGKLKAWDAQGQVLPSRLQIEGEELAILVDDDDAEYPLTIDPLLTFPSWTAESNQTDAKFGISVSTAGDVNGDGFSDVIVAAAGYDNGEADEGRAFVYHGSATGLSVTAAWTAESNQSGAAFGWSVSAAGDVNGDGFEDVIIGAYHYGNVEANEGRAFVYHGSTTGLGLSPAWTAESNQTSANFGTSVNAAGDVNGDGFADVIVGAPMFFNGQSEEGRAFVYHGSAAGLGLSPAWTAESNQISAFFGHSVNAAGDVNADGFSDVIIGAYSYDTSPFFNEGRAFVYHGSATGLAPSAAWTAQSSQMNASFGWSVGTAGDVNGDGYADVIVGARLDRNGQTDEGRAYLYSGSAAGLGAAATWTAESDQAGASFGQSVGTAGDVNGDGYADVIVGCARYDGGEVDEGRALVYHGSATGLGPAAAWTTEGNQINARYGISVGTAGDVNGDGFSEVIVGADGYDNGQADEGRAFLYRGSAASLALQPSWSLPGDQINSGFAGALGTAGDVNGDGFSDIIIGAPAYDNGESNEGRAFVFHGSATGLGLSPAWTAESNQAGANFGQSVANAGDVNGDGYSDVIVGAPLYTNGQYQEGRVFVHYGSAGGLSAVPSWTAENNELTAGFGWSVASAGDVNGDGFSDVIVGAPYTGLYAGATYVFSGSTAGLSPTPTWSVLSEHDDEYFGLIVGPAGDVNGDGFSDILVATPEYQPQSPGLVCVYHGSASGPGLTPAWTRSGNPSLYERVGHAAETAGDVNGDGFSDIALTSDVYGTLVYQGSPTGLESLPDAILPNGISVGTAGDVNSDGFSDVLVASAFGVSCYHGSPSGVNNNFENWTVSGLAPSFGGYAAGTAGDLNGDGFSDVVVGARGFNNGQQTNAGHAYMFYGNGGDGLDLIPLQKRVDDSVPIGALGASDSETRFRLRVRGRTPAGRGRVRLQWEVKPFGTPFDGSGVFTNSTVQTTTPGSFGVAGSHYPLSEIAAGGLNPGVLYHWRVRILGDSPDFPRSRWLSPAFNAGTEADVRMASSQSAVDEESTSPPAARFLLQAAAPNPFANTTRLAYTLRERGEVRLAVYDVAGRQVVILADEVQEAGEYARTWDGRDTRGEELSTGVYFVRLQFGSQVEARKIVITR